MAGLIARKKSGPFGRTWWGKQVEKALEEPLRQSIRTVRHPVISRARALARNGAVLALEVHGGAVAGEVKGSQLEPFSPVISFAPVSDQTIEEVRDALARHPGSAEQVIGGVLPEFLRKILPLTATEMRCECSCPVIDERCAHTLALGYLLVERLDKDPQSYLTLRGLDLAQILVDNSDGASSGMRVVHNSAIPVGRTPWRDESGSVHPEEYEQAGKSANVAGLNRDRYWSLSGELPPLPTPTPEPAYRQLDAVQWMTVATSISPDPVEKLTLEADLRDAWEHLCQRLVVDQDNGGEEES